MDVLFYPAKNTKLLESVAALPDLRVLTANSLEEVREHISTSEVLVTSNRVYEADAAEMIRDLGRNLRWIQFTSSGIDKAIDNGLPEGLPITNAAGAQARRVAEHTMSLLLSVARRHNEAWEARQRQAWERDLISPHVVSLEKKTIVIVGLGAIGQDLARKIRAFDMHVIGISRSDAPMPNFDEIRPREELIKSLSEADAIVLATSYDTSTHHLIDADAFSAMKPSAILINVTRGPMIDEAAMIESMKAGQILGVGLDVTTLEPLPADSPLWTLPNVTLTPHIAGSGGDPTDFVFEVISENYSRLIAGKPLDKLVQGPAIAKAPA